MGGFMLLSQIAVLMIATLAFGVGAYSQDKAAAAGGKQVLWEQVNIAERDLYRGPLAEGPQPMLEKATFLGKQPGGNNLKYRIKDGSGQEWVVKIADESQAEVAAVRLLWGIGYHTETDLIVPKMNIVKVGNYRNARFEARPEKIKRGERWSWTSNPFMDTKEFNGLKLMMALLNNWDLKDENNVILQEGETSYFIVSDLGSSFGKLADRSKSRSGRSVNNPEDFAQAEFVKGVNNGAIELHYYGMGEDLIKGIPVEHARWLADL